MHLESLGITKPIFATSDPPPIKKLILQFVVFETKIIVVYTVAMSLFHYMF